MAQLLDRVPVSRSTVYRWIEREGLPVIRLGKSSNPLFLPESVLRWLQSREQRRERAKPALTGGVADDALRVAGMRQPARRSRRTPPPPIATAGSRERLRRIHGAR
jgi:predicted DNA-binding transcriptional regulator AlpA